MNINETLANCKNAGEKLLALREEFQSHFGFITPSELNAYDCGVISALRALQGKKSKTFHAYYTFVTKRSDNAS